MKIRIDFVTNSSSSSFILDAKIKIPKNEKYPGLLVTYNKKGGGDEDYERKSLHINKEIKYLYYNIDFIRIFCESDKLDFLIDYTNERFGTQFCLEDIEYCNDYTTYEIGESSGNFIESIEKTLFDGLNPIIKKRIGENNLYVSRDINGYLWGGVFGSDFTEKEVLVNGIICNFIPGLELLYKNIFIEAGRPDLSVTASDSSWLLDSDFTEESIEIMKKEKMQIVYAKTNTKEHDVICYKLKDDDTILQIPSQLFMKYGVKSFKMINNQNLHHLTLGVKIAQVLTP